PDGCGRVGRPVHELSVCVTECLDHCTVAAKLPRERREKERELRKAQPRVVRTPGRIARVGFTGKETASTQLRKAIGQRERGGKRLLFSFGGRKPTRLVHAAVHATCFTTLPNASVRVTSRTALIGWGSWVAGGGCPATARSTAASVNAHLSCS